ncbi:MAG: GNAT family N-acetyltransferase [Pseudomonadota bacterium]
MSAAPINDGSVLVDRIMAVMDAAFDPAYGEAWNRRQITDALVLPSTHALILDPSGQLIPETAFPGDANAAAQTPAGFVLSRHGADEEELLLIAVAPEYRRAGIGETLIEYMVAAAKTRGVTRVFLEMRRGNPAIHLYRKVGFEPVGERPQYYRMADGSRVDAITFCKML